MDKDFFILIIRLGMLGLVVIGLVIFFGIIMAAGVIDNIFHAVKKSKDNSLDDNTKKNSIMLNIISAAVLMIPIIFVLIFFVITTG